MLSTVMVVIVWTVRSSAVHFADWGWGGDAPRPREPPAETLLLKLSLVSAVLRSTVSGSD